MRSPGHPFCACLRISEFTDDGFNTSFAYGQKECQFSGCDVSILANHHVSTLQHCRANSCDRSAGAGHTKELCFSYFSTPHSLCPATNNAIDCSISTSIAKLFMDVPHCLFLCNKELYHSKLFVKTIMGTILKGYSTGVICWEPLPIRT